MGSNPIGSTIRKPGNALPHFPAYIIHAVYTSPIFMFSTPAVEGRGGVCPEREAGSREPRRSTFSNFPPSLKGLPWPADSLTQRSTVKGKGRWALDFGAGIHIMVGVNGAGGKGTRAWWISCRY